MAKETRKELELLPVPELLKGIEAAVEKGHGNVSDDRAHSVETHLRLVIRKFGFRPRETEDHPASIKDLAEQVVDCFKSGEPPEAAAKEIQMLLHSAHSNLQADLGISAFPVLQEVPTPQK